MRVLRGSERLGIGAGVASQHDGAKKEQQQLGHGQPQDRLQLHQVSSTQMFNVVYKAYTGLSRDSDLCVRAEL